MKTEHTPCECPVAGFCQRHKLIKVEHWHRLCQTRRWYFDQWEQGTGPGQEIPPPPDTSCVHRSPEPKRIEKCDLCGVRGQPLEVFQCGLLGGECSLHKSHSRIRGCAACESRQPAASPAVS